MLWSNICMQTSYSLTQRVVLCRVLMLSESKIMLNGIELERNTLYTPRLHRRIQSVRQSASQSVTWVQLSNYIFLFLP